MIQVKVEYFAILREQANRESQNLATDVSTPRELFRRLKSEHQFTLNENILKCAINDSFCDLDTPLSDGDKLVFIPPVSGG